MARPLSEQTLELLDFLCWAADDWLPPHMGKMDRSCAAWQRRYGISGRTRRLLAPELVRAEQRAGQVVLQLTAEGRLRAVGGRDPQARWQRVWDGQWRMVMFDLPVSQQKVRQQLLRWFRQNGFGYLQNSVWITPDPLLELAGALDEYRDDVESLTVMEAHCHAGYSNAALVAGAWDLVEMNRRYDTYLSQANGELRRGLPVKGASADLRARLRQERVAWAVAVELDPFLPSVLLPPDYRGRQAWEAHAAVMKRLVKALADNLSRN